MLKFLLWCELIVPWLTLVFMDRKMIKKYMPVAIFVSLLVTIIYEIAYTYKWWVVLTYIVPWGYITHDSFVYGPYLVGTLWIFRITYPHFLRYLLVNVIVDAAFAFGILPLTERLGVEKLINLNQLGAFLICIGLALIIFVYQRWQERIFKDDVLHS